MKTHVHLVKYTSSLSDGVFWEGRSTLCVCRGGGRGLRVTDGSEADAVTVTYCGCCLKTTNGEMSGLLPSWAPLGSTCTFGNPTSCKSEWVALQRDGKS